MCKLRAVNLINQEKQLEINLEALYSVVQTICDNEEQSGSQYFEDMNTKKDSLYIMKQLIYTNGDMEQIVAKNHILSASNYYRLRHKWLAGWKIGATDPVKRNVLKFMKILNPTEIK